MVTKNRVPSKQMSDDVFQTPNPSRFVFLDALVSRSKKINQLRLPLLQHPKFHVFLPYRDSHSSQGMSTSFPSSATTSSSGPYYCSELLFLCAYSALQPQASHTDLQRTTRWVKSVVNRNNSASLPRRVCRNLKRAVDLFFQLLVFYSFSLWMQLFEVLQ